MTFLKRSVRGLSAWVLSFSLFMLASFTILALSVLNVHYVKETLYKSNLYQNIVPAALDLATTKTDTQFSDGLNPQVVKELAPIISRVISPQFAQTVGEAIIDGSFAWLKGNTVAPTFVVKTAEVRASLQTELVNFTQNRIASLPTCPRGTNFNNIDPLSATCKPPIQITNNDINNAVSDFIAQIPLLQKGEVSLQSLNLTDAFAANKPIQKAPALYDAATVLPFAFAALILASGLLIVVLGMSKYHSWRMIGHTFAWAGILLVIASAATFFFTNRFTSAVIGSASVEQARFATTIFTPIGKLLATTIASYSLYFGIGYCLVGAVCYLIAHRIRHNDLKNKIETEAPTETAAIPPTPTNA